MKFTLTADQISTMIADGVAKALASQGALRLNRLRRVSSRRAAKPRRPISPISDLEALSSKGGDDLPIPLKDRNDPKPALRCPGPIRAGWKSAELFVKASMALRAYSTSLRLT
jgi:hypothetical protein